MKVVHTDSSLYAEDEDGFMYRARIDHTDRTACINHPNHEVNDGHWYAAEKLSNQIKLMQAALKLVK